MIGRTHSYSIQTKYRYQCNDCGYTVGRHTKSLDTSRKLCGHCRGSFKLLAKGGQRPTGVKDAGADNSPTPKPPTWEKYIKLWLIFSTCYQNTSVNQSFVLSHINCSISWIFQNGKRLAERFGLFWAGIQLYPQKRTACKGIMGWHRWKRSAC